MMKVKEHKTRKDRVLFARLWLVHSTRKWGWNGALIYATYNHIQREMTGGH